MDQPENHRGKNIIHRDLKPENILLSSLGNDARLDRLGLDLEIQRVPGY